jgi:hypothetical protein
MVRKERYHLRDLIFNELHRHFGEGLFASDIDFLEFQLLKSTVNLNAIIEVKCELAKINFSRLQHRAQKKLANLAELPYYIVQYEKPDYNVKVYPMNKWAKEYVPAVTTMSLKEYAILLYEIRGKKCPDFILSKLEIHHIHEIDHEYKLERIRAMEKEIIKLKRELGLNGYRK